MPSKKDLEWAAGYAVQCLKDGETPERVISSVRFKSGVELTMVDLCALLLTEINKEKGNKNGK